MLNMKKEVRKIMNEFDHILLYLKTSGFNLQAVILFLELQN
jgi:hypothetical protein